MIICWCPVFSRPPACPNARLSLSPHEFDHVLHVVRVGEHVDGLYRFDAVGAVHERQVARLRGGIAAHVDDPLGGGAQDDVDHGLVDPRARRIEDDDVGAAVGGHERVVEHRLHVAGVEARVADAVERRIDLRVVDRFGDR